LVIESIRIRTEVLAAIEQHARSAAPAECCGLLIARDGCIAESIPVENHAPDPVRRYEISPRDYLDAIKRCRGTDAIVIGAYHSHPQSPPDPSSTDRSAAFGDFLYLIAGRGDRPEDIVIRAYRLRHGNFQSVRLVPHPEEPQR
jgi:desampylase